jgi:hypothetical protein
MSPYQKIAISYKKRPNWKNIANSGHPSGKTRMDLLWFESRDLRFSIDILKYQNWTWRMFWFALLVDYYRCL